MGLWKVLLSVIIIVFPCTAERTLELAQVVFRHGARSPGMSFPTDNYTEASWPQGFGQLTEQGMKEQYELGKWLRDRYVRKLKLLDGSYHQKEVMVRSSPRKRTVMSALCNLQGLFPTEPGGLFEGTPPWQPVPVFAGQLDSDYMLHIKSTDCDAFNDLPQTDEKSADKVQYVTSHQDFFDEVKKNAGFTEDLVFHNYTRLADTLIREKVEGRQLPNWVDEDTFNKLKDTLNFAFETKFSNMSLEAKRLFSGVLLKDLVTNINDHIDQRNNDSKLFMYSGHDTVVAPLLGVFNVFNNVIPPTASCVLLELYREDSGLYTVDLLFRNDTTQPPHLLKIPSCSEQCPVQTFRHIAEPYLVDDIQAVCRRKQPSPSFSLTWNFGWVLAASCLAIATVIPFITCILLAVGSSGRRRIQAAKKRMEPINFHLLGGPNSESEDESVFDT
ncbi:prostatic acid phosphatase-like [Diadema antillarum]|uniref:prostatic acid phosphatase-like n=1 Tax=Diadema antillarum TaxID=105358 RepID=UPI003A8A0A9D